CVRDVYGTGFDYW
nr:immunoglobulin heavy chain junction region [Macaca mulatta]MOX63849.1 immunoglobulin heavy chain junction region [Macaca mulatta]